MRIAICDDMPDQLEKIYELVSEYVQANHINADIKTFSHPDNLLRYCESENAQLYVLDIVMPMMSGVQLGQEIRNLDRESQIIYVTTAPEFALDSFSVHPLNYLLKPIQKDKLFDTLSLAITKIKADEVSLTIKTKNGLHTISIASVIYCEYVKHAVKYVLASGEIIETTTIKGSFSDYISSLLADKRFIQPHSAFVINMSRVQRLTRDGFTMCSGAFVPISGKLFTQVKNNYLNFRLKDEVTI
ncbi:LytTR family DNA-binding domain-containing protein [Paludicola sp. MB14-C6]|uniref:LytR/AlgR family response regulator transcription factor n=1 Tax=Paludihabitans sp. MB14-C6 TaxID=3070656 RepID=UPI0027DE2E64|nr:LytTR family DNA-binding domain-containing protein [Paludicola sp. MB14-C6]WMJ23001.1 LytTR family DNA-binding domain-containing protein [Paludicola sp. MB14-C6]